MLTVRDLARTIEWYVTVLGMEPMTFGDGRRGLRFGDTKINLHQAGAEFEPKAAMPTPGSGDLCFTTRTPLADIVTDLRARAIAIVEGPVAKTGARSALESVYVRDPDGNLIEISNEV